MKIIVKKNKKSKKLKGRLILSFFYRESLARYVDGETFFELFRSLDHLPDSYEYRYPGRQSGQ